MKKKLAVACVFLFIVAILPFYPAAHAETRSAKDDKLKDEVDALKKEVQELRRDIEGLKTKSVTAKPAPPQDMQDNPEIVVSIDDDVVLGNNNAPVTIIEFSDYQCPFCKRFFKNTFPDLDRDYIKTGKVKYVFRDFPLEFHNFAPKAAEAAHCAGDQGKYWEMHDKIFDNQNAIDVEHLKKYATEIGVTADSFNSCLDSGKYISEVNKDNDEGRKVAVSGTPTFFIGKSPVNGKEITGQKIVGARPFSAFKQIIDQLLQAK